MKPLLVFDGDCGFCRFWVRRLQGRIGDRIDYAPSQEAAGRFPEIPPEAFARSVQLIDAEGNVHAGAGAIFHALALGPSKGLLLRLYRHLPGFAAASEGAYRLVASHRQAFSRITRLLWGDHPEPPSYRIASCLLGRGIGLVYLTAFLSLGAQVIGLAGQEGILPAQPFFDAVRARYGAERYWLLPTLCWLDASDGALRLLCWGGAALALLATAGVAVGPCLALCWIFYLSLSVACRTFLSFQWDILLLEAGFLAILVTPWRPRCRIPCPAPAPRAALWLVRWLLFRLMFSSGMVKLTSGDPTWRNLTALDYHYQTQPLPPWTAWYMQQLPSWFQVLSTAVMFSIELAAPFLLFAPRRLRYAGCGLILLLQALIGATGNYGFFNLVTIVLCLVALDDSAWPARWLRRGPAAPPRRWPLGVTAPLVAVLVVATSVEMTVRFRWRVPWPAPVERLVEVLSPLRIANAYGLFAVMTKTRPEIIVEGSNDGATWRAYEFRWKPGKVSGRPGFVAPHMPRLDWQMWFAALGNQRGTPWFQAFLGRLLQGSPDVLALLDTNPFPEGPPRYIRSSLYEYTFTGYAERNADGSWWRRVYRGPYSPVQSFSPGLGGDVRPRP
jgi:predicted DCC family thiol-disulfide oxidoreductase YuxK